jgi:putative ABC transport system permease protein
LQFGAYLHAIVDLSGTPSGNSQQVVLAGFDGALLPGEFVNSATVLMAVDKPAKDQPGACIIGGKVASQMQIRQGMQIILRDGGRQQICEVAATMDTGGAEDNEVFINLEAAQRLANAPGRISLIKLSVPGTPQEITRYIADLQQKIPEGDVRGIRQFTEGEAKIYNRISGLLTATVAIVLLLTGLCVMAAMTNVAMERKMDVGLMKAIGGSMRSVLHLFLAEAALLGLAGGLIGAALGILLSMGLGKAVFGVAARPRLIVYPVAVALTIIVAILSAFPLRRLANIRPASVFRGEA